MLTTRYVSGSPNWIDLGSPDIDAGVAFYAAVFGWTYQPAPGGGYGFFQRDGGTVAAIGPLTEQGATPSWTVHFHTDDADATRQAVVAAGGTVRTEPDDVFTAGRLAAFTDPTGADFAVWQPGDVKGLDTVMEPGTLCWTELYTTDLSAAQDFYRSVFSWTYQEMDAGDDGPYHLISAPGGGEGEDTTQGGALQLGPENLAAGSRSEWHPYFGVRDVDAVFAAAGAHGATTVIPPTTIPGVGRMAQVKDPAGAVFALIAGDPATT
ncbi:hydroxylase [Streptomyces solincola]|uniref:Hydroxylase n=1 Tax=Streptomyces solincola TaxID=2100817 RepID=A0A2S9PNY0_9ACTN|nr:VOC family protein [Streptomyces solincola]PRH76103.1 hydroxylase [Streptomyces solincola]